MNGIIIETSQSQGVLVLSVKGRLLASTDLPGGFALSKELGPQMDDLLRQNPSFRAEFIGVGIGPGSYTGVRVGVALAKSLAFGWQIPLVSFCSLNAFVPPFFAEFALMVDARSGRLYCLEGSRSETSLILKPPQILSLEEAERIFSSTPHLISTDPALLSSKIFSDRKWLQAQIDTNFLISSCTELASKGNSSLDGLDLCYLSSPC